MASAASGPGAAEQSLSAALAELRALLPDLLHDWAVVAEFDGAYALHRCRICRTEVVR